MLATLSMLCLTPDKQVESTPTAATAPLVDIRTIGKAPIFTGEQKDWEEWSFQFTAYMGSANSKSVEAFRLAAMEENTVSATALGEQSCEEHNPQLYLAMAQRK